MVGNEKILLLAFRKNQEFCPFIGIHILIEKTMADLKDLKQAILEIPKLVELLKKVVSIQPATMSANFTTMKPRDGSPMKSLEQKHADSSVELKMLQENFEKKLAWMKAHFEKEMNALKENFNARAAASKATTDAQNQTLKEMFDVINRIATAPTLSSEFKKRDGEPVSKSKNVFEEAKALSKKIFSN